MLPTGYSFLATRYNLLYQCIMPNCRLTIANLRKHCQLSCDAEKYILESSHARIRCQRLLNFMLDVLSIDKDYMKFCYLLFLSTAVTDLPCQLISRKGCIYMCLIDHCTFKNAIMYEYINDLS